MSKRINVWNPVLICCILAFAAFLVPERASAIIFADGFESGDTSAWSLTVGLRPHVFRFSDLDLRDPHLSVEVVVLGCFDFTDQPLPIVNFSFNGSVEEQINGDADGDDFLDLSSLLLFRPFDPQAVSQQVDFDSGLCMAPLDVGLAPPAGEIACAPDPATEPLMTFYDGLDAGTCLDPLPGTTSGYTPGIDEPTGPCFVTVAETIPFQLGDIAVILEDVQIAATFSGDPVDTFTTGLVRGFLSEAAADALILPPDLPIVGGEPLSLLLPGGTGSCASGDDRDVHNEVSGWWFYFNYTAERVTYHDC